MAEKSDSELSLLPAFLVAEGTTAPLYVDALTAGKEVAVAYYDNNTGLWVVVKNVTFNASAKTVSFAVPGSCTVQVVAK